MLYWNLPPVVKNAQKLKIYFLSTIGTYISYILRFFIVGLGCSTPMPLYSILLDRTINQVVLQTKALEQRCVYLWLVMLESCSQMGKSQPLGRKENNPFLLLTTSKKGRKEIIVIHIISLTCPLTFTQGVSMISRVAISTICRNRIFPARIKIN